jgi:GT2 family glycosyltransferase
MTRLSAIVPATDEPATLAECLRGIRDAEESPEEVIVVEEADRPGPAAARNDGAARAIGDVLVFVDADVVPASDAFVRIRCAFDSDEGLVGLFGAYDSEPAAPGLVSQFRNLLHHHVHNANAGPATTFWAGLGAMRRGTFESSGGFDAERFPHASVEDIELGIRVCAQGGRILLDPEIRGTHLKSWTLAEMLRVDFARRGVPWTRLVLERRAGAAALNLGWRHRLSATACVSAVGCACVGRRRAAGVALGALVVLNSAFYRLLLRRHGPWGAAGGIALHFLHHLTGAAAAGAAAAGVARRRWTRRASGDHPTTSRAGTAPSIANSSRYSGSVFTDQTSC